MVARVARAVARAVVARAAPQTDTPVQARRCCGCLLPTVTFFVAQQFQQCLLSIVVTTVVRVVVTAVVRVRVRVRVVAVAQTRIAVPDIRLVREVAAIVDDEALANAKGSRGNGSGETGAHLGLYFAWLLVAWWLGGLWLG